jgi:UDP-4-amino-4,6-dideoxy-N-acetyl-beta-L-altrosamine transaminase
MIPYGRQSISSEDIKAVEEVLRSDFLTTGPVVPRFEEKLSALCGGGHAVAVNSATSALHLACLALEVGVGDTVWTSPMTFVASANCARYCGAAVDFVDIDPANGNMSVAALERKLVAAERAGTLPKVVIPVHFAGEPCDMAAIGALAQRYEFSVIEDASHAVGAQYRGAPIGACTESDIVVFSFHPVKIITTGEGGVAMTQRPELAEKMRLLRSHGITRDPMTFANKADGPWYTEQIALGFNYRMTDIQAALGLSQLGRLAAFIEKRHVMAKHYDQALKGLPLSGLVRSPDSRSALHLYVVLLDLPRITRSHREVYEALHSRGIGVQVHYMPVHLHPYYRALGFVIGDFPQAEAFYSRALSLPLFPALAASDQDLVIGVLNHVLA